MRNTRGDAQAAPAPTRHTALRLVPLLLLAGCSAATARTLTVADDEALRKSVSSARAGDRIELAPGSYAAIEIRNRRIEGAPVTITGKDARIAAIAIVGSGGWAIDGLTVGGAMGPRARVIFIEDSADIAVRNSLIHGVNVNNDPWDDGSVGIGLRTTQRVEITGNRLRDHGLGFVAASSSDIRFEGNSIAYVREGTNWTGVRTASVRCNRFSHMFPNWLRGEHPDAIQAWPGKNGGSHDMVIEGNVLLLGGPRAVQGIFMQGETRPEANLDFGMMRNITIRDNIYYGASRHGITIGGVANVLIENNTVLPSPHAQQDNPPPRSADGRRSSANVPRISVQGANSTGLVAGNITPGVSAVPPVEARDNVEIPYRSKGGKAWAKQFAQPPVGDDPDIAAFASRGTAGARLSCGPLLPPPVDAPSGPDPTAAGNPQPSPS